MTPVTIGRATLYLGDCRDILSMLGKVDAVSTGALSLHMARLAKPNEVLPRIGGLYRVEAPKRYNVVHGQRTTDVLSAMSTKAALFRNYLGTDGKPAFTSICGDPANVAGRFVSFENARGFKASAAAKFRQSVLARQPRLLFKRLSAMPADAFNANFPVRAFFARQSFFKRIYWTLSGTKIVAYHVGLFTDV